MEEIGFKATLGDGISGPARAAASALSRLNAKIMALKGVAAGVEKLKSIKSKIPNAPTLFGKIGSGITAMQKRWETFKDSGIGKAAEKMTSFAKDAVFVGGAVALAVGAGVASLAVEMADFGQRSRLSFEMLTGGAESGNAAFQRSIDLAKELGLNIQDSAGAMQSFLATGFSAGQSEALIKMGADMQVLGASTEDVKRAFLALGQIKSAGTLQGDELNQLAEAKVPKAKVFEQLAKQLGVTVEEVIKLKEAGEITASQAINAVGAAVLETAGTKDFGIAGKKFADSTLGGMLGKLKARAQEAFLKIGEKVAPALTKTFESLSNEVTKFLDSSAGSAFLTGITDAIESLARWIPTVIPLVKDFIAGFSGGAVSAFKEISAALGGGEAGKATTDWRAFGAMLGKVVVFAGALVVALAKIAEWAIPVVVAGVQYLMAVFNGWTSMIGSIIAPFVMTFETIMAVLNSTGLSIGEKVLGIGRAIVTGILQGITGMAGALYSGIRNVVMAGLNAAKAALGIASPSKEFAQVGKFAGLGLVKGLQGSEASVANAGGDLGSASLSRAVAGVGSAATGGGGAQNSISISVQMTAQQGVSNDQAQAQGRALARGMESELMSFFEGVALQGAAA